MQKSWLTKLAFVLALAAALTAGTLVSLAADVGTKRLVCPPMNQGCFYDGMREVGTALTLCCVYDCFGSELLDPCI